MQSHVRTVSGGEQGDKSKCMPSAVQPGHEWRPVQTRRAWCWEPYVLMLHG